MDGWQAVLVVCGGIATLGGAAAAIQKLLAPLLNISRRVEKVEAHDDRDMRRFEEIDKKLARQNEENQAMMKALYALLGHSIDGNSIEALKGARASLTDYIIEKD